MRISAMNSARWLARIAGTVALVLGAAYWLGVAVPLHAHMAFGGLLVPALFLLAYGTRKQAPSLSLVAAILGLVIPTAGMLQLHLPWGDYQWAVRFAHVCLGLGGIAAAEKLGATLRRKT